MSDQPAPSEDKWIAEQVLHGDLDRVPASMNSAGERLNAAREWLKGAQAAKHTSADYAIAGAHDAARKAIAAHMTAKGVRVASGEGGHKKTIAYARNVLGDVLTEDELEDLEDLRSARAQAEYGAAAANDVATADEYLNLAESVVTKVAGDLVRIHKASLPRALRALPSVAQNTTRQRSSTPINDPQV